MRNARDVHKRSDPRNDTDVLATQSKRSQNTEKKEKKRKGKDGVKTEGFQRSEMAKDTLSKRSILYSKYHSIKSNILNNMER